MKNVIRRSRAKRNTKGRRRRVQRRRNRRIVQRAVDTIKQQIMRSEDYQEYVDELRDFELQDIGEEGGIIIELEDGREATITAEPVANIRYQGFRTYYVVDGNPRVIIQTIRTGPGVHNETAFGA